MSWRARWEYFRVIFKRYREAKREEKKAILNEFRHNTKYNRKYAIRLLNGPPPGRVRVPPPRPRRAATYGAQVVSILAAVWEAAGYPWSVRLKALLPLWMPWVRKRFRVTPAVEAQLQRISPRQIDRRLGPRKQQLRRRIYGRTKPGALLKHHIPLQADHWQVKVPGFAEVDLVAHSGNSASGEFAYSLNLTDVHSGWRGTRAILGKGHAGVLAALEEIRGALPFPLLGLNSDNGSEFINWPVGRWCAQHRIQFTRSRPYQKDDNAYIEQKNWTHVRKLLGWDRYETAAAVEAMNESLPPGAAPVVEPLPSLGEAGEEGASGSRLRRIYDQAQMPLDRVLAWQAEEKEAPVQGVDELVEMRKRLDPFALAQKIEGKLRQIYGLAHERLSPRAPQPTRRSSR